MGFRIGYLKLLTLRCWHPDYLGSVAAQVPIAPADPLTVAEKNDYLAYDLRPLLDLRPTEGGAATLARYGLIWTPSNQGGWLLAKDTFTTVDPTLRLQLGVYLRDPGFAAATDFGIASKENQLFHLSNANLASVPELDLAGGNLRSVHYFDSSSGVVQLTQTNPGTDGQVLLRDPLLPGNPVLETFEVAGGEPTTDTYRIDLRGRPSGLYRFTGTNITNQTVAVGFSSTPGLLGVVELQLADWAGSTFDLHFQSSNP